MKIVIKFYMNQSDTKMNSSDLCQREISRENWIASVLSMDVKFLQFQSEICVDQLDICRNRLFPSHLLMEHCKGSSIWK